MQTVNCRKYIKQLGCIWMDNRNNKELDFFCERLKYYRKKCNMTQSQFSERIGVSEHYVRLIENGYSVPSVELFQQICKALDVPAYNLLQSSSDALRYTNPVFYEKLKSMDEKSLTNLLNTLFR